MLIRGLSALILALLIGGAVRPSLIAALRPSWRSTRPAGPEDGLSIWPLRFSRDPFPAKLVSFFEKVRKEIPRGASVAVLLPEPWHRPEYAYARSRLRYLLARHPVAFPSDSAASVFENVDYVAAWHPAIPPPHGLEMVFSQHEGVLMRRGDR